jgi:hypothetical protein
VTSPLPSKQAGFSLAELLIAASIGVLTAAVAGDLLISHLRSGERAEAMERQRSDWARTSGFIEADVALSERVIDQAANIAIPASCGIRSDEFRLGLDLRRDLPPVIYAVRPSTEGWLADNTLWRCGPGLNNDGSYNTTLTMAPILDGLDASAGAGGFLVSASSDAKRATFTLALKGHARITYSQQDSAHTRISPLYGRPSENSLCDAANMVRLEGRADTADTLVMSIGQVQLGEDVLICGRGYGTEANGLTGDAITGSDNANDILEGGDYGKSTLNGMGGNDVLRGTQEADSLQGGSGDDVLVGRGGNDTLQGGGEKNSYLPGAGDDTVVGGGGLDIVFYSGNRSSYSLGGCTKTLCTVQGPDGADTLRNVEILIFQDARVDLPD